eukprot:SAG31_NODE_9202_length_1317_cov_1.143678_1_plen_299_part_00
MNDYETPEAFLAALEEGVMIMEAENQDANAGVYGPCDVETLQIQASRTIGFMTQNLFTSELAGCEPDPELPPPPEYAETQEDTGIMVKARALYDWNYEVGAQEGDLLFQANDIIIVTSNTSEWWTGHLETSPTVSGQFSSTYVQVLPSGEVKESKVDEGAKTVDTILPEVPGFTAKMTATALYDYIDGQPGDLLFSAGTVISVTDDSDPSWWKGFCEGAPSNVGTFPSNYVQPDGAGFGGGRFLAVYDFEAQQEGDLGFFANSVIVVTQSTDPSWWVGYVENDPSIQGQFPSNYVQPC